MALRREWEAPMRGLLWRASWLLMAVAPSSVVSSPLHGQALAEFDVPALVAAQELKCLAACELPDRLIQIVLPVSTRMDPKQRDQTTEFRFDVSWLSEPYPIVDYQPRTMLQSEVSGLISVEQQVEDDVRLQTSLMAPVKPITAQGQFDFTKKSTLTSRMSLVPKQELLIASGTIDRGTGVFFRFHSSAHAAFEGGRELWLTVRVPPSWRGGLLRVSCRASGLRKSIWGMHNDQQDLVEFTVPVYLAGDAAAQEVARRYAVVERQWRQASSDWSATVSAAQMHLPQGIKFPGSAHGWSSMNSWVMWNFPWSARMTCKKPEVPEELGIAARELADLRATIMGLSAGAAPAGALPSDDPR